MFSLLTRPAEFFLLSTLIFWTFAPLEALGNEQKDTALARETTTSALLSKAQALVGIDNQKSETLGYELLDLSIKNRNDLLTAKAHSFLASLYEQELSNSELLKHHLTEASIVYFKLNDIRQYLASKIQYANVYLSEKNYKAAYSAVEEYLPVALEYGDRIIIAGALEMKGRILYERKRYSDSEKEYLAAITQLDTQNNDQTKKLLATIYHQLGQIHKRLHDYDKSSFYHQKSLNVKISLNNESQISKALKNVANAEYNRKNYLTALDYAIRGMEIQKTLNEPESYAKYLTLMAIIYRYLNRYETAMEYSLEAYQLYLKIGDIRKVADSLIQLGVLCSELERFQQAKVFYQKAIALTEENAFSTILAPAYRELAIIELQETNYSEALAMAEKALFIYQEDNNQLKSTIVLRIIGDINYAQGHYEQAISYFLNALSLTDGAANDRNTVEILNRLGKAQFKLNADSAISTLERALAIAIQENFLAEQADVYDSLMKAASAQENYKAAFEFAEAKIRVSKLIYQDQKNNRLAFAKAELDSHIMENEIKDLRKQVDLDKLKLEQQNNEIEIVGKTNTIAELELAKNRYANFLLASLLLICLCGIFYVYRIFITSKKRNIELDYLATHDQLTHCLNRRGLFDFFEANYKNDEIADDLSIIMLDIDHFKKVNDVHGHDAGDEVLRGCAKALLNTVRRGDLVARYGGEEFCIVLLGTKLPSAEDVATKLRKKIETTSFNNIKVTGSFGIACTQSYCCTPVELIARADKALYKSKADGRNTVTVWSSELDEIKLPPSQ